MRYKNLFMLVVFLMHCVIIILLHSYIMGIKTSKQRYDKTMEEQNENMKSIQVKGNIQKDIEIKPLLEKTKVMYISQSKKDFKIKTKYNKANIFHATNKKEANKNDSKTPLTHSGSFQNLSGIFILSAFYDQRIASHLVRLIALQEKNDNRQMLCWFKKGTYLYMTETSKYKMCENHGRKFEGRIYSCHVPTWLSEPKIVFISIGITKLNTTHFLKLDLISLAKKVNQKYFGICIPPLFGSIPMTKLVQFFELSQILGASHFHFYLQNVSSSIHFILNYYAKLNLVSMTRWELPSIVVGDSIWYHGQLLAIQDCLYKNMARFKYLLFLDLDEFIIPRNTYNWADMIASIKNKTKNANESVGFSFKSAFFDPWQMPEPSQQLSYLQLLERSKEVSNVRTKVMIEADRAFEMGIHHLSKPISEHLTIVRVSPDIAIIHHYRSCIMKYEPTMQCKPKIRDTMILKYSKQLQDCYNHRVKELFKQFL